MIGTSSPRRFWDRSGLLRICAEGSAEESIAPITAATSSLCRSWAGGELGQGVVLRLLLERLALFEPVLDVGNDAADAGVGVIAGEEVIDLCDDLFKHHREGLACSRCKS